MDRKFLQLYDVVFSGLKEGVHIFSFELKEDFFETYAQSNLIEHFENIDLLVELRMEKKPRFLQCFFSVSGPVELICDRSGRPFTYHLKNQLELLVQFGEVYNDDDETLLIVPEGTYKINIAQYLYEVVLLGLPVKRLHPDFQEE